MTSSRSGSTVPLLPSLGGFAAAGLSSFPPSGTSRRWTISKDARKRSWRNGSGSFRRPESAARMWRGSSEKLLTGTRPDAKLPVVGETESRSEERDSDSRPGRRAFVMGVYRTHAPNPTLAGTNAPSAPMPLKTPGFRAEPQGLVNVETSGGPDSRIGVTVLSSSR